MNSTVFAFDESADPARQLACELGIAFHAVEARRFPDGESLVRVPEAAGTAILYRSLDDPNSKIVELLLAACALRDRGARQVMLVAPYLAYMRQDIAFRPGEAVSQRVIGRLLADYFDGLMTIDPHLHRTKQLGEAVPQIPAISISAAPVLAGALSVETRPLLVGPDSEARRWVEAIAAPMGLEILVGEKRRIGDRRVDLAIPGIARATGRNVVLVDDVISSGTTMIAAAKLLLGAGAARVEALATHGLVLSEDLAKMKSVGISRIQATQSVASPIARLPIAALLAGAMRAEDWA